MPLIRCGTRCVLCTFYRMPASENAFSNRSHDNCRVPLDVYLHSVVSVPTMRDYVDANMDTPYRARDGKMWVLLTPLRAERKRFA